MQTTPIRRTLSRRGLLKLLSAGGIAAVGGYLLFEYAPWLDYEAQASLCRLPMNKDSRPAGQMQNLIRYATLAASGHNAQPWKFVIKPDTIEIHPDYTRRLLVVDPGDRELWISLGCALENLMIAARAVGYMPEVTYPETTDFLSVRLTAGSLQGSPLFDVIPLRQNTRSEYDGQRLHRDALDRIQALPLELGIVLRFVLDPADTKIVLEYVEQGNRSQYGDRAFVEELVRWLRFNKKEAMDVRDGLYSRCAGSPEVPRWLGQMFVARTKPGQQTDADAKNLRSSSGAVVIASELENKTAWVRTGQVYERLALTMTALNIKSAFLNQPIEAAGVRGQFQSALGIGKSFPQLLVRFGYADPMPRSLRRPVEQVLVFA